MFLFSRLNKYMLITTQQQWEEVKYKDNVTLQCDKCHEIYKITKYQYCCNTRKNGVVNFLARTFCSKNCRTSISRKQTYTCLQCTHSFLDHFSSSRKFCSHTCAATYNNLHRVSVSRKVVQCVDCSQPYTLAKHIKRKRYVCTECKIKHSLCMSQIKHIKIKSCQCKQCGIVFAQKHTKRYCSKECKKISVRKYRLLCQNCQIPYASERSNSKFCSHTCRSIKLQLHVFAHKKSGASRSKIEIHIESKIREDFQGIEFIFNDKREIGIELDIYSPQLKLAIELNGVFHYLPIFGHNVLDKIQSRDRQKPELCTAKQIILHTINLGDECFTKHYAKKIYSTVYNIIALRVKEVGRPGNDPGPA